MIKKKLKPCQGGCGKDVVYYSKKMCLSCYFKVYRKKSIPKKSTKQLIKNEAKKELLKEDFKLYDEIWVERGGKCQETGQPLEKGNICNYHHCLPKGIPVYAKYRHCKWVIVLISFDVHQQAELDVTKLDFVYNYTRFLRDNHNEIYEDCGENDLNKEWKAKYKELWRK